MELRGFGVLETKTRGARMGRNPRTGEPVPVSERRVVIFKPGKDLKELVANSVQPEVENRSDSGDDQHSLHAEPDDAFSKDGVEGA